MGRLMSNGNALHFEVDVKEGRLLGFQPVPGSLRGTKRSVSVNGHRQTFGVLIANPALGSAGNAGRFSFTVQRRIAPFVPTVRWDAVGHLNGKGASGTRKGRIVVANQASCTPAQGRLTGKVRPHRGLKGFFRSRPAAETP